jgi:hypothetical protein
MLIFGIAFGILIVKILSHSDRCVRKKTHRIFENMENLMDEIRSTFKPITNKWRI